MALMLACCEGSAFAQHAVSREITTFNYPEYVIPANTAVSREMTTNNDPAALLPANQAVSREITGYLSPYTFTEIAQALRIAAGLNPATSDERLRLDVVIHPPSYNIVDILDGALIWYLQSIAPPVEDG